MPTNRMPTNRMPTNQLPTKKLPHHERSGDQSILDVDLVAFESGTTAQRDAVVDGVMRSLRTGFVYVATDLSTSLIDDVYEALETFFGLPAEVKQQFVAPGTHGQTGYTGLLVETAADSDVPDWKEMINWSSEAPAGHPLGIRFPHRYPKQVLPEPVVPGITELLFALHDRLFDVQRRFLRIVALGLGCHESLFDRMIEHGPTLSRAIHYPSMQQAPGEEHVWAGAHGDINLITALPRATAKGLQVLGSNGWDDVVAPEGMAVINTGMMLEHLTNGLIPTGVHRVVADPGAVGDRYSVVQFCHPTPWTILSPLAACVTPDRPQRFPAMTAGDRLDEVLWQINLGAEQRVS
jgi:isopenicillin N synthase-like dioxygenase